MADNRCMTIDSPPMKPSLRRRSLAVLVAFFAAGPSGAVLAQDAGPWLGAPDCRIAALEPVAAAPVSWSGACRDGHAEGRGVVEWRGADGIRKLEAVLARGVVQGEATLRFPDGGLYIGTLTRGIPDGKGYFKDADGMQYEGEVRMGLREGLADGLLPNGDRYQGQWKDGRPEGMGRMTYMLGGAFEGRWRAGVPDGRGIMTFAGSGRRAEVGFLGGHRIDLPPPPAAEAEKRSDYSMLSNPATGSLMPRKMITSRIPLALGYEALSPAHRQIVRERYPALDAGDEPPYPLRGPRELFLALTKIAERFELNENLSLYVQVGPDGKVESVTSIGIADPEARRLAGLGAGLLKYKPARCGGQPCRMIVPFDVTLSVEVR